MRKFNFKKRTKNLKSIMIITRIYLMKKIKSFNSYKSSLKHRKTSLKSKHSMYLNQALQKRTVL